MTIRPCNISSCQIPDDVIRIQAILNHAITTSTALYDYEPRSNDQVCRWAEQKIETGLPLIGAYDPDGALLGFGTYGPFRPQPAYKYTIEHSIYVDPNQRGRGIATALMGELIKKAESSQYHVMVGCIDVDNAPSIALHQKFGFVHCGTVTRAGFKFGRWLDAAFYQKVLSTPTDPVDG
jgi:phosphinothricin acetyltransferase